MSQIETVVVKQGTPSRKVLSCSFFTMADAYRSVGRYESNLRKFMSQRKKLHGFETRIYTDDSGIDAVMEIVKAEKGVTVIKFNCPEFREGRGHVGTFGTLVRFLPLFEDLDTVWISDIDVPDAYLEPELEIPSADIQISTFICYSRKVYGRKYTIVAGRMISHTRFQKSLLTNFVNKILGGGFSETIKALNDNNRSKPASKFPYGTDEVFTNTSLYDSIKRQDLRCHVTINYNAFNVLKYSSPMTKIEEQSLLKAYNTPTPRNAVRVRSIYERLIPYALDKYPCLNEYLDNKDKIDSNLDGRIWVDGKDL